jgi:hypothetical protein
VTREVSNELLGTARAIAAPEAPALDTRPAHDGTPTRASGAGNASVTRRRNDLDLESTLDVVRDNLGRADAFITAAEELIERPRDGGEDDEDDDGLGRHRNHVAHLVESAKLAVRAALYGGDQIAAALDKHQVET